MKSTLIAASLCVGLVAAGPVDKRWLTTEWDIETVTVTVTGDPAAFFAAAATPTTTTTATGGRGGWFGGFGGYSAASTSAAAPAPTSSSVVPSSVAPTSVAPAPSTTSTSVVPVSTPSTTAPSTTASSTSSSAPVASSSSSVSSYAQAILDAHNLHRKNNTAPDLTWSDNMASIAQTIAASCVYAHDTTTGGGGYGQNIGAGAQGSGVPAMIGNEMYNGEINSYPAYGVEPDMGNFEAWGHYSQIVWKSTTSVGCYTQYCPNGLANVGSGVSPYFTVCNYSPPGNFGGEYAANVGQPLGEATVTL